MRFNPQNKALIQYTMRNLETCGYKAHYQEDSNEPIRLFTGDEQFIGLVNTSGDLQYMNHQAQHVEKLQSIIGHSIEFADMQPYHLGQKLLCEYEGTVMSADINPDTGKPVYYVTQEKDNLETTAQYQRFAHLELDTAKAAFAEQAGLAMPDRDSQLHEQRISAKFIELLQESKYRLVHSSGTPDVSWKIYQGNNHVGNVGKDLNITITTDLKNTRANMESILDRAKWEVAQSQSHTSIFTKRLADNLIRLGFTVQHFWQQFQMHLGIHKNDRLVATVDPHDKITFQPEASQKEREAISAARNLTQGSLQANYEQYIKEAAQNPAVTENSNAKPQVEQQPGYETWSERATPENAPDNPGKPSDDVSEYLPKQAAPEKTEPQPQPEQTAPEKSEPQPRPEQAAPEPQPEQKPQAATKASSALDLTDKEKLFMLGLLCSPQCKELAGKYDMTDQIRGIVDKINESSPHLTRQARESEPPPLAVEDELDQMEM